MKKEDADMNKVYTLDEIPTDNEVDEMVKEVKSDPKIQKLENILEAVGQNEDRKKVFCEVPANIGSKEEFKRVATRLQWASKGEDESKGFYEDLNYTPINDAYVINLQVAKEARKTQESEPQIGLPLKRAAQGEDENNGFYKELTYTEVNDEYVKELQVARNARKRKRYARFGRVAAIVACLFVVASAIFIDYHGGVDGVKGKFYHLVKQPDQKTMIGDEGISEIKSETNNHNIIKNWSDVKNMKKKVSELLLPEYVPYGYEFKNLAYDRNGDNYNMEYRFTNLQGENISIIQNGLKTDYDPSLDILNVDDTMKIKNLDVYFAVDSLNSISTATYYDGENKVFVSGPIPRDEIIKIVQGLEK